MSTTIYNKFFYVYKITNLINNKIYIGVHQSESLNDDYMGSGLLVRRAQEKYGIENFKKEILFVYDNKDDMFAKEKEIVNESFVQDKSTYNLKVGGEGGWDHIYNSALTDDHKQAISKGVRKAYKDGRLQSGWTHVNKAGIKGFLGKSHSIESRRKISENNKKTLDSSEWIHRKEIYKTINFSKRGSLNEFAEKLNVTHTQARRIKKRFDSE